MNYIRIVHYADVPTGMTVMGRPSMTTRAIEAVVRVDSIDVVTEENGFAVLWVCGKPMRTKVAYAVMTAELGLTAKEIKE